MAANPTKSVDELLSEVRDELARLNQNQTPSLPRFSIDGALRIVERPESTRIEERLRQASTG